MALDLRLPDLRTSEEAEEFGRTLTRDQFIFLEGAKVALQREFERISKRDSYGFNFVAHEQERSDLAFRIQMINEAQAEAPLPTLVALLLKSKLGDRRSKIEAGGRHLDVIGVDARCKVSIEVRHLRSSISDLPSSSEALR